VTAGEVAQAADCLLFRHLDRGQMNVALVDLLLLVDVPGDLLGPQGEMRIEDGRKLPPLIVVGRLSDHLLLELRQPLRRGAGTPDRVGARLVEIGFRTCPQDLPHPGDELVVEVLYAGVVGLLRVALVQRVARLPEILAGHPQVARLAAAEYDAAGCRLLRRPARERRQPVPRATRAMTITTTQER
jgi:hypothetical protein